MVSEWLINSWAFILTLILTVYVALDGFDLGIGILSLLERDRSRQVLMMESLSGVWDANETWLVLMGGTLFGAFPLAYAQVLPSLYVPVLLMLFGLVFRGVAFEFRLYARRQKGWILAFGIGSLVATLAQGLVLGAVLRGLPLWDTTSEVNLFSWANPFSLLTAISLTTEPLAKLSNGKQSTLIKAPDKPVFRADGALLGHLLSYFVVFIKIRA
jgi:cytochrome bd ubiquinol oxidase subunit II